MIALAVAALFATTAEPSSATATITVGGVQRSYQLFAPASAPPKAPLVIVLHGRFGTASQVRQHTRFDVEAAARGALVAYPQGMDRRWSDARQLTLDPARRVAGHDDVGFVLALVDTLVAEGRVDPARVYVTGHSNGGFLALTLACTHAERFAGVGAVAASLPKTACAPSRAVPLMLFHGTADTLVPFEGGGVGRKGERGLIQSNAATAEVFARVAGCQAPTRRAPIDRDPKDGTRVIIEERAGCSAPVVNVIVEGGGHGWPGRPPRLSDATREIDATAALAAFFLDGTEP